MKAKLSLCLFLILAGIATGSADVLIYKGVARFKTDIEGGSLRVATSFLVIDFQEGITGGLFFFNFNGVKKQLKDEPGTAARFITAPLAQGRTATVFTTSGEIDNGPDAFQHTLSYVRGTNNTVLIRALPFPTTVNRPRILKGLGRTSSRFGNSSSFNEVTITYILQSARTIRANNENQSVQQAVDQLSTELEQLGFLSN